MIDITEFTNTPEKADMFHECMKKEAEKMGIKEEIGVAAHVGEGKVTTTERIIQQVKEMDNVIIIDESQKNPFTTERNYPITMEYLKYAEELELQGYMEYGKPQTPKKWQDGVNVPVQPKQTIGRNFPCTCGSGKKYKRCCGK